MPYTFVARQPIFSKNQQAFGYELLFRTALGEDNYNAIDGNKATLQVIENSLFNIGIDKLTNGRRAFINFPTDVLMAPFITSLPKQIIVVEILETVLPTKDVIQQCQKLKEAGFHLALDDFSSHSNNAQLIPFIDYLKVDFLATNRKERRDFIKHFKRPDISFLAEKVETHAAFKEALHDGYNLFQGYFFSKPEVLNHRSLHIMEQTSIEFMRELMQDEINFNRLECILSHDVSLSYKILRFINSSFFGFNSKITSIRQALTLLGKEELYKWSSLFILSSMIVNKPTELLVCALVRARFCELMSKLLKAENPNEFFLAGMFSLMDAFLDQPLEIILDSLPINRNVKAAILGKGNAVISNVLQLAIACEKGSWEELTNLANQLQLAEEWIASNHYNAQLWCTANALSSII